MRLRTGRENAPGKKGKEKRKCDEKTRIPVEGLTSLRLEGGTTKLSCIQTGGIVVSVNEGVGLPKAYNSYSKGEISSKEKVGLIREKYSIEREKREEDLRTTLVGFITVGREAAEKSIVTRGAMRKSTTSVKTCSR